MFFSIEQASWVHPSVLFWGYARVTCSPEGYPASLQTPLPESITVRGRAGSGVLSSIPFGFRFAFSRLLLCAQDVVTLIISIIL